MLEIERKWLLREAIDFPEESLPTDQRRNTFSIAQGYLGKVRIRRNHWLSISDKINYYYHLTYKTGEGLERKEYEDLINLKTGEQLFSLAQNIVEKERRHIPLRDIYSTIAQVDIWKGNLEGLITMEIEFNNIYTAEMFTIPEKIKKYIVREVTNDSRYNSINLARTQEIPTEI